jgi:hypothetical protein
LSDGIGRGGGDLFTPCNGENELYVVVDEILTGLSIETIETSFVDWMNRVQHLIDGNVDYVS